MASSEPLRRLNALLAEALELPPAERADWLRSLPDDAQALLPQLRALLQRAAVETDTFMRQPAALAARAALDAAAAIEARPDQAGDLIGPWRLCEELGAGGMSTVWLAERADGALVRQVALKLPRIGWAGSAMGLVQRMARERDLLAALEHPHIARLYDAGVSEGRPWLAMERVSGEPIDMHCRDHALSLRDILALVLQVCDALAHAHARLIVHRDLKPANILVTPAGEVRLLDFGIGKLLHDAAGAEALKDLKSPKALTQPTQLTQLTGRALTPDYASPEQVANQPVTVATDIYSLGIVLYELLAGERPYRLPRQSLAALEEAILTADVPSASTRCSDRTRARALRGDLDAVLAKALAREPQRRYTSIETFAADLRAWLAGQPVAAQAPRRLDRSLKFVRRNAWAVAMSSALALSLLVGLGAALWQTRAARMEAARAEQARQFIAGMLRGTQPRQGGGAAAGGAVRTADLLVLAGERIEAELADDAALAAELGVMVGERLSDLGEPERGESALRAAVARAHKTLGPRHLLTVRGRALLAESLAVQRPDEARAIADALVPDALAGLPATADEAVLALRMQSFQLAKRDDAVASIAVLQQAVAVAEQHLGVLHEQTLVTLGLLSNTHGRFRQFDRQLTVAGEAMSRAQQSLGAARPHITLTAVERWYGEALRRGDRPADAEPILRRVLKDQRLLDGSDTPRVRNALFQLGLALGETGRIGEGIELLRQVVAMEAQQNSVYNEDRVNYRHALGVLYGFARRDDEMRALATESESMRAAAGIDAMPEPPTKGHALLARLRNARVMSWRGEAVQAEREAAAVSAILATLTTPTAPAEPTLLAEAAQVRLQVARLQRTSGAARQRARAQAERDWKEPWRPAARPGVQAALAADLAALCLDGGDAAAADLYTREALALYARAQVLPSPLSSTAWIAQARLHLQQGRAALALAALDALAAGWGESHPGSEGLAEVLHWRAQALQSLGRPAAAHSDRAASQALLRQSRVPALRGLVSG